MTPDPAGTTAPAATAAGPAGTPRSVLIVGASVGGVRTAQALREEGFDGEITIVGAEPTAPYDKPPLSKELLTGRRGQDALALLGEGEQERLGLTLRLGTRALGLDPERREVHLSDATRIGYGALVVATGARPRTLPPPADRLVHTVRELADGVELAKRLATGEPVAVVGGGFVGAEVAASAAALGCRTTLIERSTAAFSRILGERVGSLVTDLHRAHGVEVIAGTGVRAVVERTDGTRVLTLDDGRRIAAGTVVAGIGCVPDTSWLEGSGVCLEDGVVTDEFCAVPGHRDLYAVGDVARWYDRRTGRHRRVEHWTNAAEQAALVARNLTRPGRRTPYAHVPYFWSDQHGVKIQSAGDPAAADTVELLRCTTPKGDKDVALYSRNGRLTAAVTFGWPRACATARRLLAEGGTVAGLRAKLAELAGGITTLEPGTPAAPHTSVERPTSKKDGPKR
ncbi:NAD(P)/FAD-dependent oxidoreductase [Streptomyces sp. TS71-3]|uniref:NAD(P)/FAD-dependent oxidoreductase n=1 Tax=Streptomyces sp. TS71-3 TaxID=2733862 RepID=UPI001B1EDAF3|nr:FAD/NAD(P)-binding oxidoreductase [Streptomyces sp. TS71-3]GHJ35710.1 putative ferredoxin reductase [Streptomyces sp. TS71-3]